MYEIDIFNEPVGLENERYILRIVNQRDYLDVYEIYSDEETLKYQMMKPFQSKEEAKDFIKKMLKGYHNKEFIRWAVERKEDHKLIGLLTLKDINNKDKTAELGYILNKKYWHQGIMYETVSHLIDFLFHMLCLKALKVQIHPENTSSINLALALGFIEKKGNDRKENGVIMELINMV